MGYSFLCPANHTENLVDKTTPQAGDQDRSSLASFLAHFVPILIGPGSFAAGRSSSIRSSEGQLEKEVIQRTADSTVQTPSDPIALKGFFRPLIDSPSHSP